MKFKYLNLLFPMVFFLSCSNEQSECKKRVYATFGSDNGSCLFFFDSVTSKSSEAIQTFFLVNCLGTKLGVKECNKKSEYKPQLGDW